MRWIMTYTGLQVDPCEPDPSKICLEDIAHHLSLICRYGGATSRHYSVAEHSVLISQAAPEPLQLLGLLHDAGEYISGDILGPMKDDGRLGDYVAIADAWQSAVYEWAGLDPSPEDLATIKKLDRRIVLDETAELMAKPEAYPHKYPDLLSLGVAITGWRAEYAEILFALRFWTLTR